MKKIKLLLYFFTLFTLYTCSSCKVNKSNIDTINTNEAEELVNNAISKYLNQKDSILIIHNEKNNLSLYLSIKQATDINPNNHINFFVFDKIKNIVVYNGKYSNANISWYNNNQLLLERYFGIIEDKESGNIKKYIIDLKSGKVEPSSKEIKTNI